jgi:hypothetical protein
MKLGIKFCIYVQNMLMMILQNQMKKLMKLNIIKRKFNVFLTYKERARMKDEYNMEELQQDKLKEIRFTIARNLLTEGLDPAIVAKTTGLSAAGIKLYFILIISFLKQ